MNEADSQHIAERAVAAGYRVATAPEEANVVVINTCTVRDNAERRAYGRMNHLGALKRANPGVRLVVTGCLAEQDREVMRGRAPHVDAVFGTSELAELGDQLAAWQPNFDEVDFSDDTLLLEPLGGTADGVAGAFSPSARLRHRTARLFLLLHVLHRAARARALRSPSASRYRRRRSRTR